MYFSTLHKCAIFSAQILQFSYCNRPDFPRQLAHLKLWQPAHLKRILNVPEIFSTFCPSLRPCACTNTDITDTSVTAQYIDNIFVDFRHLFVHVQDIPSEDGIGRLSSACQLWWWPLKKRASWQRSLRPFSLFKRFNIILYCQSWLKNWMFEIKKQISTFIIKLYMYMYTCAFLKWKKSVIKI